MRSRKAYLQYRRELLVSQAAAQRSEIACIGSDLQKSLGWVDMGITLGRTLRSHPLLALTGGSLLLRMSHSKRLIRAGQLLTAWELFSVVRQQWSGRQS